MTNIQIRISDTVYKSTEILVKSVNKTRLIKYP